jgi:hypothetical protein
MVNSLGDDKKVKLSCGICDATYYAENVDFPAGTATGSMVPYTCPICDHKESKVE